jgi:hypothetical protein
VVSRIWIPREPCSYAGNGRRAAKLSLVALVWLSLVCGGAASAARIGFPDDVVLSDPSSKRLELGSEYVFEVVGTDYQTWDVATMTGTINVDARVSFLDAQPDANEFMVVFTSIRVGSPTSVTCSDLSPGGSLPFANFDYVPGSSAASVIREAAPTDSRMAGESEVCNAEDAGSPFFGLIFAPNSGDALDFSFQVTTTASVTEEDLQQLRALKQGYMAVPEPSTALMVLGGLWGVAAHGRRTGRVAARKSRSA